MIGKDGEVTLEISAKTNIREIMADVENISKKIKEASDMIDELASKGVLVEFVIKS